MDSKLREAAYEWLQKNFLMYRGDNASDCMVAAFIAGGNSNWISVKDRLPDKECYLFIYDGETVKHSYFDKNNWWLNGAVTYWHPIPMPPDTKKKWEDNKCVYHGMNICRRTTI